VTRIENGMGKEIIMHMEKILCLPGKTLLCARYAAGPGAIQAFFVDHGKKIISWYWFKLYEEVKNPLIDTAHITVVCESKMRIDEFLKFLTDEKAPVFKIAPQFEQGIKKNLPPKLVLDFSRAGINLESNGRELPPLIFPTTPNNPGIK
jgi:hypothetical protein